MKVRNSASGPGKVFVLSLMNVQYRSLIRETRGGDLVSLARLLTCHTYSLQMLKAVVSWALQAGIVMCMRGDHLMPHSVSFHKLWLSSPNLATLAADP